MTKLVNLPESPIEGANLIAGEWQKPSGERIDVISPWSGESIGSVPQSTQADVDAVVAGAKAAFAEWQRVPLRERTQILYRFRELLLEHLEELAHLDSAECGKTVAEARAGVLKGVEIVEFAASLQNMDDGATMEVSRGVTCETRREPLGVVVGITPFNFPAMVPMWMYPIAVTVGNAFILKPSEKVPFTANRMGQLMLDAGFPPGVFSVIHGGKETVEALCDHPDVEAVGFVGSTPIAKSVYARATSHGKRALCLGGAKNHLIVVPDADLKLTSSNVPASAFGCAGQRCMAASVMLAVGEVDHIIDAMVENAKGMTLGEDMGAINTPESVERITRYINDAEARGAKVLVDGRQAMVDGNPGNWIGPTIIDHVSKDMPAGSEEIFGPVLSIIRVDTVDDAIAHENGSAYGNAAAVFTTNGGTARYVMERVSAGMCGVNIGVPVPREPFPFGGWNDSKFGHGDLTGFDGYRFWTRPRKTTTKWAEQIDQTWMG